VFVDRVLRRMFGSKGEEVTGSCRRLHNEKLHGLYASPYIIMVMKSRMVRLAGRIARMGELNAYNVLVRKREGKRPRRIPRHRWEDNIRMDLSETGWEVVLTTFIWFRSGTNGGLI
jgi:hypothetical protein